MRRYTHRDASGMPWRWEGGRPVSAFADSVMAAVMAKMDRPKKEKKKPKKSKKP